MNQIDFSECVYIFLNENKLNKKFLSLSSQTIVTLLNWDLYVTFKNIQTVNVQWIKFFLVLALLNWKSFGTNLIPINK